MTRPKRDGRGESPAWTYEGVAWRVARPSAESEFADCPGVLVIEVWDEPRGWVEMSNDYAVDAAAHRIVTLTGAST